MIKILVVGPSWVGDMVMAQSLFKALKAQFVSQNLTIDVLAPAWTHALLSSMPEVDAALAMPLGHGTFGLSQRYQLGKSLRAARYTHAYILPNSWKSALIPWFAKIPNRIGWRGEMRWGLLNDCRKLRPQQFPYMVQRFVALAEEKTTGAMPLEKIPLPSMQVNADSAEKTLKKFIPQAAADPRKLLALCPGAEFGPSKQWPAAYYATIAKQYIRAGWRVCILGSANDAPIATEILNSVNQSAEGQQHCLSLAGKTQLQEAIELLALSTAVVSNDSGLMHIAAALGKPIVAVFGSTDPSFTPPLTASAKIIESAVACRPCFERTCPLKHHQCMQTVYPTQVTDALQSLLMEEAT